MCPAYLTVTLTDIYRCLVISRLKMSRFERSLWGAPKLFDLVMEHAHAQIISKRDLFQQGQYLYMACTYIHDSIIDDNTTAIVTA